MSAKIIVLIIALIIFAGLTGMFLGKLTYENDSLFDLIKKETPIIQEQPSHEGPTQPALVMSNSTQKGTEPVQPALVLSNSTQIGEEPALILSDSTK